MSNLATRVVVALFGIPMILLVSLWGGTALLVFVLSASSLALNELYGLAETKGIRPMRRMGIVIGLAVVLSFSHNTLQNLLFTLYDTSSFSFPSQLQLLFIVLILTATVLPLTELFRNAGSPMANVGTTLLGIIVVPLFFGTLVGIRELFQPLTFPMERYFTSSLMSAEAMQTVDRWGGYTLVTLFCCIWLCDTAAYFVGLGMGKHKLFPRVSPNKTWEGAVAGFLAAVGTAVGAQVLFLEYLSVGQAVVFGIIVGVFGQLGDLVESLFKRDAGVKDSSAIIPGHGGVYDRFDSLLFVSPLLYLYLDFVVFS